MNFRNTWKSLLLAFVVAGFVSQVHAQDKKEEKKPAEAKKEGGEKKPEAPKDAKAGDAKKDDKGGHGAEDPMMAMMMTLGQPGPEHKNLASWVGNWEHSTKWRMDPSAPWGESKGTTTREALYGGRFIRQETKSSPMGEGAPPFEGRGIYGYDNWRKQYFSLWIDNEGTGVWVGYGSADASGKIITYSSDDPDWNNPGKLTKGKSVYTVKNDKTHLFEMYGKGKDGKEYVMLEVTYTKK